jgi:hypothetical protein
MSSICRSRTTIALRLVTISYFFHRVPTKRLAQLYQERYWNPSPIGIQRVWGYKFSGTIERKSSALYNATPIIAHFKGICQEAGTARLCEGRWRNQ